MEIDPRYDLKNVIKFKTEYTLQKLVFTRVTEVHVDTKWCSLELYVLSR